MTDGLGRTSYEVRYGVTSLPASSATAARLLEVARREWSIENELHYRRDVSLHEDAGHLRRGTGPQVMAALNKTVIGLMHQHGERNLPAVQRSFAYAFDRMLAQLRTICLNQWTLHKPWLIPGILYAKPLSLS